MDVPSVTADHVRQMRQGYPETNLVYAGSGVLTVRSARDGVVEGEHLGSSQWLDDEIPAELELDEQARRLNDLLYPAIEELVARERTKQILDQLNSYQGNNIWFDVIDKLPDLDRRVPHEYPSYIHSAYDQRHHDATATTDEFVALGERVTFSLDRREQVWRAQYTK